jgi:Uma2 family endonuclease
MASMVLDQRLEERLKAERALSGADRFDEVWEGIYMMAPLADDEHQEIAAKLTSIFQIVVGWEGDAKVRPGVNISDRDQGWEHNYRCPDVVVFMPDTKARNLGAHWMGGPDFAVEIVSPDDRTRDKLDFYASVKVRELLIIDRRPWALELYRLDAGVLKIVSRITAADEDRLAGKVLPLQFRFAPASRDGGRPQVEVSRADGSEKWLV